MRLARARGGAPEHTGEMLHKTDRCLGLVQALRNHDKVRPFRGFRRGTINTDLADRNRL